jgi:hypothetical protein
MSKVTAAQLLDKYWKKTKLEPDPIEPRWVARLVGASPFK